MIQLRQVMWILIQSSWGKTAQQVILDLKEKYWKLYDLDEVSQCHQSNTNRDEALSSFGGFRFC
jgi:Holliday junction resolvasome RuvABC DNA-binding subunit